jgi:DNA-binding response OmpR family regulator
LEGFEVIEARDGLDALHNGRERFGGIDVLVTDLMLHHRTGKAVAEALRIKCPQLPVLFLTGEPLESVKDGLGPLTAYLRKPCDHQKVISEIQNLLANANADKADRNGNIEPRC